MEHNSIYYFHCPKERFCFWLCFLGLISLSIFPQIICHWAAESIRCALIMVFTIIKSIMSQVAEYPAARQARPVTAIHIPIVLCWRKECCLWETWPPKAMWMFVVCTAARSHFDLSRTCCTGDHGRGNWPRLPPKAIVISQLDPWSYYSTGHIHVLLPESQKLCRGPRLMLTFTMKQGVHRCIVEKKRHGRLFVTTPTQPYYKKKSSIDRKPLRRTLKKSDRDAEE